MNKLTWRSEKRQISELTPADYNPRMMTEQQAKDLSTSIERFDLADPLVINADNKLIGGHQRLTILKSKGITEIDVRVPSRQLTEKEEQELNIRSKELDKIFQIEPEEKDDAVPESAPAICKRGEIYQLGRHRLMCGDSTDGGDVALLMDGHKADLVFTDPPYGVKAVSKNGTVGGEGICAVGVYSQIIGDETTKTAKACYDLVMSLGIKIICLWGGNYYSEFCPSKSGWIVWDKRGDMPSNNFSDCELAWTNQDIPARIYKQIWLGMIKEGEKGKRIHPTQKPVNLAVWCFNLISPYSKSVLDLFLGSGSTLIACEKTNRICYGMEIDPHYCDVIIKRWEDFTGLKAH